MIPSWLMWATLAGNTVGACGVSLFALAYSRIRFERSPLGIALMSAPVSTLVLASAAILSRLQAVLGWTWLPVWLPSVLVGLGWSGVGVAYVYLFRFLLRVQREERGL